MQAYLPAVSNNNLNASIGSLCQAATLPHVTLSANNIGTIFHALGVVHVNYFMTRYIVC